MGSTIGEIGNRHRSLLHDDWQCRRKRRSLEFELYELHRNGKLQLIHLPIFVHVSKSPAIEQQNCQSRIVGGGGFIVLQIFLTISQPALKQVAPIEGKTSLPAHLQKGRWKTEKRGN